MDVPQEIRTERLLLRSGRAGDGPALQAAIETSLPDLFPWLSFSGRMPDLDALEHVSIEAGKKFAARDFFVWRAWEPKGPLAYPLRLPGRVIRRIDRWEKWR